MGDEYQQETLNHVLAAEETMREAEAQRALAHDLLQGLRRMRRPEREAWIRDFLDLVSDSGVVLYATSRPKR